MKQLINKWNNISLILRIVIGLVIGVILALVCPQATAISVLGDLFVGALKGIAPILVFVLVVSSLANAKGGVKHQFRTVIFLYMLSTFLAAVVAVFVSFAFPVTLKLTDAVSDTAPQSIFEVLSALLNKVVANPVAALTDANYIGILFWSLLLGIALKRLASDTTKNTFANISDAVSQVVRWVINLAPFGILGLVFSSVSSNGLGIFKDYGKLLLVLVGCMLGVALIVDPIIAAICLHRNPYPLVLRCFKESGVTAFFTRSSAANIPVNMNLCKELGLDKDTYSVSIPLGATINMGGAAVTISILALAATHTLGISVDFPTAIILCVLSAVSACGASGVAGGSLLLVPLACSLFGISNDLAMQVVGVGFIVGVIQDSCETALNSSTDVLYTAVAELSGRRKAQKQK